MHSEQETSDLTARYRAVRSQTVHLCEPLSAEDHGVQSMPDASPTKWHLAHTTWFYETFLLPPHLSDYQEFHPRWGYLFNSYYNAVGERVARGERGVMSLPALDEVHRYRRAVDQAVGKLLAMTPSDEVAKGNDATVRRVVAVDGQPVHRLSGLPFRGRGAGGVQRQVHVQPAGAAGRVVFDTA